MKLGIRGIALTALCACFVSIAAMASADGDTRYDVHQIKRTEARLDRLQNEKARELADGRFREAARTQDKIDFTRGELRAERKNLWQDRHGF